MLDHTWGLYSCPTILVHLSMILSPSSSKITLWVLSLSWSKPSHLSLLSKCSSSPQIWVILNRSVSLCLLLAHGPSPFVGVPLFRRLGHKPLTFTSAPTYIFRCLLYGRTSLLVVNLMSPTVIPQDLLPYGFHKMCLITILVYPSDFLSNLEGYLSSKLLLFVLRSLGQSPNSIFRSILYYHKIYSFYSLSCFPSST